MDIAQSQELAKSGDMSPVAGTVDVDIPPALLWECFSNPRLWPRWNDCFLWAYNTALVKDEHLIWCFKPIRAFYPYVMPAIANIVELEPGRKVTWEVEALPGFYAHHTYSIEPLSETRSRFGSWEKACGPSFRSMKRFWIAHFTFVKDKSLEGARKLEDIYRREGSLYAISEQLDVASALRDDGLTLLSASIPVWFYGAYVKPRIEGLAPGVHAVLGGGGNSLVVEDGGEALVGDPKFPPGSHLLAKWVRRNVRSPVTRVVDTHYHYDHTQGNEEFPRAAIIAHERVPRAMLEQDGDFWADHRASLPSIAVPDAGQTLRVGQKELHLFYPGPAHTRADLVVYLPAEKILATGDIFFHTYYPFFDVSKAGVSFPGIMEAIRRVADTFPEARVVMPGHGPLATLADLRAYASYLDALVEAVSRALDAGQDEREAVRTIDLSRWNKTVLPSFHGQRLSWGTRSNNIRNVYRILAAARPPGEVSSGRPRTSAAKPAVGAVT